MDTYGTQTVDYTVREDGNDKIVSFTMPKGVVEANGALSMNPSMNVYLHNGVTGWFDGQEQLTDMVSSAYKSGDKVKFYASYGQENLAFKSNVDFMETKMKVDNTYLSIVEITMPNGPVSFDAISGYIPPTHYTMTFRYYDEATKGYVEISKQTLEVEESPEYLEAPQRDGKKFVRWEYPDGTEYDWTEVIREDTVITAIYEDVAENPKTGDHTTMFLWMVLLFASAGVLVKLNTHKKRKRVR